jgi:hypothetical protein
MCHRRNSKRATMLRPRWPESTNSPSEIPGTIHSLQKDPRTQGLETRTPMCARGVAAACANSWEMPQLRSFLDPPERSGDSPRSYYQRSLSVKLTG